MKNFNCEFVVALIFLSVLSGCKNFLDVKPNQKLATPTSLKALKALLDDQASINNLSSGLGEASADNYYIDDTDLATLSIEERNTYIWGEQILSESAYLALYRKVNIANIVLEEVEKIPTTVTNSGEKDFLKGSALFIRANAFFTLANAFVKQFDKESSKTDLGIPLRLSSNFNIESSRSTALETYKQIEKDGLEAMELLPEFSEHPMRTSKWAAYAFLSRLYLSMRDFVQAEKYSDLCLSLKSDLMDFNDLDPSLNYPIRAYNTEVIYNLNGATVGIIGGTYTKIPEDLYDLYDEEDLRKVIFFQLNSDGTKRYKGSYYGTIQAFTGLAIDEVYLTKAECLARDGKTHEAMDILNSLLIKRYDNNNFIPKSVIDSKDALELILTERRKELLMRDIRFGDLKRLNKEDEHKITLRRVANGKVYELPPNDNRYALPIPQSVILITGIEQNPR